MDHSSEQSGWVAIEGASSYHDPSPVVDGQVSYVECPSCRWTPNWYAKQCKVQCCDQVVSCACIVQGYEPVAFASTARHKSEPRTSGTGGSDQEDCRDDDVGEEGEHDDRKSERSVRTKKVRWSERDYIQVEVETGANAR